MAFPDFEEWPPLTGPMYWREKGGTRVSDSKYYMDIAPRPQNQGTAQIDFLFSFSCNKHFMNSATYTLVLLFVISHSYTIAEGNQEVGKQIGSC